MKEKKKRNNRNNIEDRIVSELFVKNKGELCEIVDFGNEKVEYRINSITEHMAFGIYFSFNQRFET